MDMEKKSPLRDVMNSTMEKVREMVDANNIVGAPITTPDGVTLIPISRVSFGFGSGGGDYGKPGQNNFVPYLPHLRKSSNPAFSVHSR